MEQKMQVLAPENEPNADAMAQRFVSMAESLLAQYQGFAVRSEADYERAGEEILRLKAEIKAAEAERESWVKPLNAQVKRLNAIFKRPQEVFQKVVDILSAARLAYKRKQQEEAERIRREQEEAARREQARLDRLALERAARAEKRGDYERAEEILATVPQVAVPVGPVAAPVPETRGLTSVKYWYGAVQDKLAFVTAIAAGEVPIDAIPPKAWEAIDGWVTAQARAGARSLPGCRYWQVEKEKGTGQ